MLIAKVVAAAVRVPSICSTLLKEQTLALKHLQALVHLSYLGMAVRTA